MKEGFGGEKMSPPLISDYKKSFALKRYLQSFLGGAKIFRHPVLIALQLLLFLIPAFILASTNYIVVEEDLVWKSVVSGVSLLLISNFVNFIVTLLKRDGGNIKPSESLHNFLEEEDQEEYEGIWKFSTWSYVAPNAGLGITQVGVVMFTDICIASVGPMLYVEQYNFVVRALGIFTVCTAHYAAVIHVPPEVATFDPGKKSALMLTRPIYVLIIGIGYWFSRTISDEDGIIFCALLALLPLLWVLGILPPADALLPWGLETVSRCFGGVPSVYYFGTVLSIIFGILATVLTYVAAGQNRILLVPLQCVFAYFLSCDVGALLNLRSSLCEDVPAKVALLRLVKPALIVWTSVTLILISAAVEVKVNLREGMILGVMILALSSFLLREILIVQKEALPKALSLTFTIWDGILAYVLQLWIAMELRDEEKYMADYVHIVSFGRLLEYMLAIRGFAGTIVEPKMTALDLSITSLILNTYYPNEMSGGSADPAGVAKKLPFVYALFIAYLVRQRLFRTASLLRSIVIVSYSFVATSLIDRKWKFSLLVVGCLPISIISLVIAIGIDGATLIPLFTLPIFLVGYERPGSFWKRSWFPNNLSSKSITGSVVEGKSLDWTIYAQLAPGFARNFVRKCYKNRLRLEEGQSFLGRYEDRIVFLRVVSVGWNFVYLDVKGLEMQEQTSCHHQEAAAVDEILDGAFGNSKLCSSCTGKWSQKLFGSLQPMMPLFVPTYAESKSTIQGLSSGSEIEIFRGMFFRAFSYLWIKKNPIFQGESYKRPVASGYNFGGNGVSHDLDSDDDDFAPPVRIRQQFHSEFTMNKALKNFTMVNVGALPGMATGYESSMLPPVQAVLAGNDPTAWYSRSSLMFPHLPGMDDAPTLNHNNSARRNLNQVGSAGTVATDRGDGSGLNQFWVRKCVGETIPCNAVKNRVEKLCWKAWRGILEKDEDIIEIDLRQFFEAEFHKKARQLAKMSSFGNISMEETTLKAFRYAAKLTLNEIFTGETFIEESDGKEDEIFSELMLYEKNHKFCPAEDIPTHIDDNQKHIFSMKKLEHGASEIKMLNYVPTGVEFRVGKLSKDSLYGLWANLSFELLYLTSDDDERLSIQNDVYLLRNICTQCANPPLGYPVYDAMFKINIFDKTLQPVG